MVKHHQVITGQVVASSLPVPVVTVPGVIVVDTQLVLENVSPDTLLVNDGASIQPVDPGARLVPDGMTDGSVRTLQVVTQGGSQAITLTLSSFAHTVLVQALVGSR